MKMEGIAIGFDDVLTEHQTNVPIPRGYNQEEVMKELIAWENKQQQDHESLKKLEARASLKYMMKVEDKLQSGVYKPKYDKATYPWVQCMPSLNTQTLLWEEDLVVDAIGNPNGRCLWYALSLSMGDAPTTIRDKVMKALLDLHDKQTDEFTNAASIFLYEEDENENRSQYAVWFAAIAGIDKNGTETDKAYHKRVRLFSLNLEVFIRRKRYFFLVKYLSNCQRMYSSAIIFLAFFHAYPQRGVQMWRMPSSESLNRYLSQPDGNNVEFTIMLYAGEHFTLLRKCTEEDCEPSEPRHSGRPLGTSAAASQPEPRLPKEPLQRKKTEQEEQEDVWGNMTDEEDGMSDDDDDEDTDGVPIRRRLVQGKAASLLPEMRLYLQSTGDLRRGCSTITKLGGKKSSFFGTKMNVPDSSKCARTLSLVREVVTLAGSAIDTTKSDFIARLFDGTWLCRFCFGNVEQGGSPMVFNKESVANHLKSDTHGLWAKKTLHNTPITDSLAKTNPTAMSLSDKDLYKAAISAYFMSLGIPSYVIPKLLDPRVLNILKAAPGGMPSSARTLSRSVLNNSEAVIRDFIKNDLLGIPISITADSVMTNLSKGVDLLVVMASSPLLAEKLKNRQPEGSKETPTGELLLGQREFRGGCSGLDQARAIRKIMKTYDIQKWQLMSFSGDNVSKNKRTARLLGVNFANCLPHSLNLVLKKFMNVFTIVSQLHVPALYINLGASMARRHLSQIGFGIRHAKLDSTATRWDSQLKTLIYLLGTIDKESDEVRKSTITSQSAAYTDLMKKVKEGAKAIKKREEEEEQERNRQQQQQQQKEQPPEPVQKENVAVGIDDDVDSDDDEDNAFDAQTQTKANEGDDNENEGDEQVDTEDEHVDGNNDEDDGKDNDVEDDHRPRVWIQLMKLVSAADNISKTSMDLMRLLSDWTMYAEGLLITDVLQTMPSMINMAQGGYSYKSKSSISSDDTIIKLENDVSQLMNTLTSFLTDVSARDRCVLTAIKAAKETARKYLEDPESEEFMTVHQPLRKQQLVLIEQVLDSFEPTLRMRLTMACENVLYKRNRKGVLIKGVPVNSHINDVLKRLYLRRVFLLRANLPDLVYKSSNEDAIMTFLSPLLPKTDKNKFQDPFADPSTQTQLHKAYLALKDLVNGTSILAPIAGTVDKPVEFFLARYKDKSLTPYDHKLSQIAMRALCAPISSASAERIGSRLRKLGEFDRMQMGDIAMRRNLYFSGNGIYTNQLVSIASHRADLSEGPAAPLPPAASISLIEEDQTRPLPGKPDNKELERLKRRIASLEKQLRDRQGATPNGPPQPNDQSILRFFSAGRKTAIATPALQQRQRDVEGGGSAPALRTNEAVEGLAALRNNHDIGDHGLGKRQRSPSGDTSTLAHEKGDEGNDDDEVINVEDLDNDALIDDDDNLFGQKTKKTKKGTSSKSKSGKSTSSKSTSTKK